MVGPTDRREADDSATAEGWNHNSEYHQLLIAAVPNGAQRALDVGCGEGQFARKLRERVPDVTGIDSDEASVDLARESSGDSITFIHDDFLAHPFEPQSFDAIFSVAVLHHMDASAALARMRALLRPGGVLGIIGLARSTLADLPFNAAGIVASGIAKRRRSAYEPASPTLWPPPESFAGMRRIIARELPGATYRRHMLWRYTALWRKPAS